MLSKLIKIYLVWGLLLFIVSRILFYVLSYLFSYLGLGIISSLASSAVILLFAAFAGYRGVISLSKTETINQKFLPIFVGVGIVFFSLLFTVGFNYIILRRIDIDSIGLLRFIAVIIGGYIGASRIIPLPSVQASPLSQVSPNPTPNP